MQLDQNYLDHLSLQDKELKQKMDTQIQDLVKRTDSQLKLIQQETKVSPDDQQYQQFLKQREDRQNKIKLSQEKILAKQGSLAEKKNQYYKELIRMFPQKYQEVYERAREDPLFENYNNMVFLSIQFQQLQDIIDSVQKMKQEREMQQIQQSQNQNPNQNQFKGQDKKGQKDNDSRGYQDHINRSENIPGGVNIKNQQQYSKPTVNNQNINMQGDNPYFNGHNHQSTSQYQEHQNHHKLSKKNQENRDIFLKSHYQPLHTGISKDNNEVVDDKKSDKNNLSGINPHQNKKQGHQNNLIKNQNQVDIKTGNLKNIDDHKSGQIQNQDNSDAAIDDFLNSRKQSFMGSKPNNLIQRDDMDDLYNSNNKQHIQNPQNTSKNRNVEVNQHGQNRHDDPRNPNIHIKQDQNNIWGSKNNVNQQSNELKPQNIQNPYHTQNPHNVQSSHNRQKSHDRQSDQNNKYNVPTSNHDIQQTKSNVNQQPNNKMSNKQPDSKMLKHQSLAQKYNNFDVGDDELDQNDII